MADGGALFNATAVTTAGGHANLRTTALSAAEWDAVSTAVYNQPLLIKNAAGLYGTGPAMAINPRLPAGAACPAADCHEDPLSRAGKCRQYLL